MMIASKRRIAAVGALLAVLVLGPVVTVTGPSDHLRDEVSFRRHPRRVATTISFNGCANPESIEVLGEHWIGGPATPKAQQTDRRVVEGVFFRIDLDHGRFTGLDGTMVPFDRLRRGQLDQLACAITGD